MLKLTHTLPALIALYVAGAAVAVADDLASLGTALTKGTYLNAPGPLVAVQALAGFAAVRGHRAGAAVLAAATTLSLAAAAFDGDVGHAGLTTAQVAFQLVEVAAIFAVWAGAVRTVVPVLRRA